jgi:dTDP-4-amino-4,6-dideoxygalactose transaminase
VPVFADVEADSGNISAASIAKVITSKTKAVICVHLAGWPCDMDSIMALSQEHGFKVIEDCAQAHGARYKGRPVGSIGHVGAWSFCQDKIMTTAGEGGMVTTRDEALWRSMWAFKDHGKSYEAVYERQHAPGFRWLHESFGTNWRMLEIQAVVGRIQLKRMAQWQIRRAMNAKIITDICARFKALRVPAFQCNAKTCAQACATACVGHTGCVHANYKLYVYINPEQLNEGWTRDKLIDAINAEGVPCAQGSCSEVYLEKAFDGTGWRPEVRLPTARQLGDTSLMFLVHPTLTDADIQKTCNAVSHVMYIASKA